MLIRSHTTTLLQIFGKLLLYSQVIFKSMKVADDASKSNSECEWVKAISSDLLLQDISVSFSNGQLCVKILPLIHWIVAP